MRIRIENKFILLYSLIYWKFIEANKSCSKLETILPCRCAFKNEEIQVWCSHSNLPQTMEGIKAVEKTLTDTIDEFILENNQLPALPGTFFGSLRIIRLMLRYNGIERVSNGWLNQLENNLIEIFMVEPNLRSIPAESLHGLTNLEAVTIQSDELKRIPDFSGITNLKYLNIYSKSLIEFPPIHFRKLPKLESIHLNGGKHLTRLEIGLFDNLKSLRVIDLSHNGINWIHLRSLYRLPNLINLKLSDNKINDVGMVGRVVKDLENLQKLRLDHNLITVLEEGSLVDLPMLTELYLNDNKISEIHYGAFHRTPNLRIIFLQNNKIKKIHPESFMQTSGSGVESLYLNNNEIDRIEELRSLLDSLPALKFLELSQNQLTDISYGILRGHGTLEQLHLNDNFLSIIDRDALIAMPALRELRLRNNSLSDNLPMPFWNLPGLKGLDLSLNSFRRINSVLLSGLPSLRRLDLSENFLNVIDRNTFSNTPFLETLNISNNEIFDINPLTFKSLDKLFEVDASFNKFKRIIPGLPKIIERISMRGNMISELPLPQASKSLDLPNLRMLDLSRNLLEYIPKFTFQSLEQLRVLSFAYNKIRVLEDLTFMGANRLELLHLQDNLITDVEKNSFQMMLDLRNLNLQGNKMEILFDNMFTNNSKLEQLDLSRNNLRDLPQSFFRNLKRLEFLDLSGNILSEMPESLANIINIKDIDVSFNHLMILPFNIVGAWKNVVEIRLSNNQISELKHGTIMNLPKLQYLDLSSNEIQSIEPSALKNLPELQELVLADNKLVELKDRVFENLNSLQAVHLQHNQLKFISPEAFYNLPTLVYLNLSENNFHNMDNVGLRSMRSLEVLDLSANKVKIVNTMPLKILNWLVELKMDNNQICKIYGLPFETMPRLRVLSIKNNKLRTMHEKTFQKLRGNIAVLDIEGNPIRCSCEMQWLSVWLDETNSPNPGPKCQNGKLLRASRLDQTDCGDYRSSNYLPLFNEHGDYFGRHLQNEFVEDCEIDLTADVDTQTSKQKPFAVESEYFYDQYVDYPTNDSATFSATPVSISHMITTTSKTSSSINLVNNTLLNFNTYNKTRPQYGGTPTFTFFGYPLPSLNFGRFFNPYSKTPDAKGREQQGLNVIRSMNRGKVRMFKPTDYEFEKYLKGDFQFSDANSRSGNYNSAETSSIGETYDRDENPPANFMTGKFKSPYIEKGGFLPIFPGRIGGFIPVLPNNKTFQISGKTTDYKQIVLDTSTLSPLSSTVQTKNFSDISQNKIDLQSTTPKFVHFDYQTSEKVQPTYYVTEDTAHNDARTLESVLSVTPSTSQLVGTAKVSEQEDTTEQLLTEDIFPLTSTSETILLIPPAEEQEELSIKLRPWSTDFSKNFNQPEEDYKIIPSSRSNIKKVFQQEYSRGVTSTSSYHSTPGQPTAEEYSRAFHASHAQIDNEFQSNEFVTNSFPHTEEPFPIKKHGMEWYYENYKNSRRRYEPDIETAKGKPKSILRSQALKLWVSNFFRTNLMLIFLVHVTLR
ncbi:protein artichoke [Condylostylus longicornis]|uniref:protein artichoke n=1 Tax=Condylostylus longicornis TaxID=2530218 RepID=UPI00244DD6DC|nr:protein artichoke [Condylostylus longicornis]